MIYVLDSSPLIALFRHYYPERFPSLWEKYDSMTSEQSIISVREVLNEIDGQGDRLSQWAKDHRPFFTLPTAEELDFVAEIFKVKHFQALIRKKERLVGKPVADPFVIAKAAKTQNGCVVTQEIKKENAAQIPNVCDHFHIPCMNLEVFMAKEDWTF